MAETMLERAARAVMTAQGCGLIRDQGLVFCEQCDCHDVVRAVLQAIRTPDEHMVAIGIHQAGDCTTFAAGSSCISAHCYTAMIDSILSE